MKVSWKSFFITILQFFSMFLLFLTGPWFSQKFFLNLLMLLGLGIWIWSFAIMLWQKSYGLFPEVGQQSVLINYGPYKLIRHPIYSGLLLLALGFVLNYFNFFRGFLFLLLLVSTLLKLNLEEKFLLEHFKNYSSYQKKTKRLIPFVY